MRQDSRSPANLFSATRAYPAIAAAALGLLMCTASAAAKIVTRSVPYEHDGVTLEGFLVYDDEKAGAGKLPGVLLVHEWWGLNDFVKEKARRVAELGHVAFALDMYGAGVITTDVKKATELSGQFYGKPLMAERARAGLDRLVELEFVDQTRIAAIGYCFGGAVCQALAYSGAPLSGMVSFHGSLVPASLAAARANKAKFLICHGAIDPFISKEEQEAFLKSMDEGKFDYQFITYADALHAFTNPSSDRIRAEKGLNGVGYNRSADRRSWTHMKSFFSEIFAVRK